ncbi:hypothetical protein [uncultured Nostoc sp.]|uniref:hypothetical protein n=1 Tax=uncultured Nostoc sp. TaxID=340711 RepID=UPI0035CC6DC2
MTCTVTTNERSRYFLKQAHFLPFRATTNTERLVLLVELGKKFEVALSNRLSRPCSGIKTPCGLPTWKQANLKSRTFQKQSAN